MQANTISCLLLLVAVFGYGLVSADGCVPNQGGCSIGCSCFEFNMVEFSAVDETSTQVTFEVTNNCKYENSATLSNIKIEWK